jgi:uncharacterized protein
MATMRTYPPGVPCWIDTEQPDPAAARAFYGELFGWEFSDVTPPGAAAEYHIATLDGRDVAAIASAEGESAAWRTYVAVDDVEAAAASVRAEGGRLVGDVTEAGEAGRLAVCADPEGAGFRLWQAGARPGAQMVNAPGGWNFSHLQTRELAQARAFYEPVFGWQYFEVSADAGMWRAPGYGAHLAATVDPDIYVRQANAPEGFADVVAGVEPVGDDVAPRWRVVVSVVERDGAAGRAESLGATVVATRKTMWTREADLRDPQGAELTISQFAPPDGF